MSAPNPTLYIKNLNEKVKRDELVKALYLLFTAHGVVLDVVASKSDKMRGQAFVVFEDVKTSSAASRSLQGFEFYGKPLRILFALKNSFVSDPSQRQVRDAETRRRAATQAQDSRKRVRE